MAHKVSWRKKYHYIYTDNTRSDSYQLARLNTSACAACNKL